MTISSRDELLKDPDVRQLVVSGVTYLAPDFLGFQKKKDNFKTDYLEPKLKALGVKDKLR